MKIEVKKLPERGCWFEESLSAKEFGLDFPHCEFKDPIEAHLFVSQVSGDLLAQGSIRTQVHVECSRCLNYFVHFVDLKKFTYCEPIENRLIIDLTDSIGEDIILTLPSKPLCQESCHGLCVKCGQNLNIDKCKCQKSSKDLRLADLDKINLDT